jgi:hypothetical protein
LRDRQGELARRLVSEGKAVREIASIFNVIQQRSIDWPLSKPALCSILTNAHLLRSICPQFGIIATAATGLRNCKKPAATREIDQFPRFQHLIHIGLWSNSSAHRIIVSSTANQVPQRTIYRLQKLFRKPSNTVCYGRSSRYNAPRDHEVTHPMKKQASHPFKTFSPFLAALSLTFVLAPLPVNTARAQQSVTEQEAHAIGVNAYLYFYRSSQWISRDYR